MYCTSMYTVPYSYAQSALRSFADNLTIASVEALLHASEKNGGYQRGGKRVLRMEHGERIINDYG